MLNSEVVTRRRYELGMAQGELATAAGISESHLSEILSGRKGASAPVVARIAKVLKVKPAVLLDEAVA